LPALSEQVAPVAWGPKSVDEAAVTMMLPPAGAFAVVVTARLAETGSAA